MTTQKRKVPEIASTAAALAVEDPPEPKTESTGTPEGNGAGDHEPTPVAATAPNGSTDTPPNGGSDTAPEVAGPEAAEPEAAGPEAAEPEAAEPDAPEPEAAEPDAPEPEAAEPDADAEAPADAPRGQDMSEDEEPDTAGAPTEPVESAEQGELVALAERISAVEAALALQQSAIADVGESFQAAIDNAGERLDDRIDDRIADGIAGSIAVEVERVTTDELVEAKRNLSLAAHSMAHLALGITESAESVTGDLRPDSITALLHSFRAEVDNILLQLGYSPLDTQVGERFDPNRHRSLRRIPTDDVRLDRLIAKVIRDGYRSENTRRILVYSDVEVHRYQS